MAIETIVAIEAIVAIETIETIGAIVAIESNRSWCYRYFRF